MIRKLPSLHLLHVFDAAGRQESFKLAAHELHITPSAVSHQIKALEEQLGFQLFLRGNRKLELTEGGKAYHAVVGKTFSRLREGTRRVRRDYGRASLRINVLTSLGRRVIIPRLDSLQARLPGVSLHIETTEELADFNMQDLDVAVRYGLGDWPGLVCDKLVDLVCTPVCSAEFGAKYKIDKLDFREQRLIHMAFFPEAWSVWSHYAGLGDIDAQKELWFDTYDACIDAAEQGLGLALALLPLEQASIDGGRLVAPIDQQVPLPQKMYTVYRPEHAERPEIKVFHDWLLEQFQAIVTN